MSLPNLFFITEYQKICFKSIQASDLLSNHKALTLIHKPICSIPTYGNLANIHTCKVSFFSCSRISFSERFYREIHMSCVCVVRKLTFCICENIDADQLRGNREADQRLCFRYIAKFLYFPNPKFQASRLQPSSVADQPGLYLTRSETRTLVFS